MTFLFCIGVVELNRDSAGMRKPRSEGTRTGLGMVLVLGAVVIAVGVGHVDSLGPEFGARLVTWGEPLAIDDRTGSAGRTACSRGAGRIWIGFHTLS